MKEKITKVIGKYNLPLTITSETKNVVYFDFTKNHKNELLKMALKHLEYVLSKENIKVKADFTHKSVTLI